MNRYYLAPASPKRDYYIMTTDPALWHHLYSAYSFVSISNVVNEQESTGKWLVPLPFGDPDDIWEKIAVAAARGLVPAAKLSGPKLDEVLGHHLACVYSWRSGRQDAAELLSILREIGVDGQLEYKSCLATAQGRDDILWSSTMLEAAPVLGR